MKHLLTSILLLSFCSSVGAQTTPPADYSWTENPSNGHFYAYAPGNNALEHINETNTLGRGTELVTIRSQSEEDWIANNIPLAGQSYLMGLTDSDDYSVEGTFVWLSGELYNPPAPHGTGNTYENWLSSEPNNGPPEEDFVTANALAGGTAPYGWNDVTDYHNAAAVYEFIPSPPQTITVDIAGLGDFLDIQSAIDFADNGDTVIVRDGTYFENVVLDGKSITFQSENGPSTTTIDGSASGAVIELISSDCTLEGFTIINGRALRGAGVQCRESSTLVMSNCMINNNDGAGSGSWGGGMGCSGSSTATITDCTFSENEAAYGAGIHFSGDDTIVTLDNCTFNNNDSEYDGGGIYAEPDSSNLIITNCIFTDNDAGRHGGGIQIMYPASADITDCIIQGCHSGVDGGGLYTTGTCNITSTTFSGNNADSEGGGICARDGMLSLSECNIDFNTCKDNGGGISAASGIIFSIENSRISGNTVSQGWGGALEIWSVNEATITNCLIVGNAASAGAASIAIGSGGTTNIYDSTLAYNGTLMQRGIHFRNTSGSVVNVSNCIEWGNSVDGNTNYTYSCIAEVVTGTGNISTDPLFVDSINGDYRLQHVATGDASDSPCIDTGDPSITPYGSTRTDGILDSGIIDIGFRPLDTPIDIDSDSDGLGDTAEASIGTDPMDQDTDDDGLSDGEEVYSFFTDPLNLDTDSDGIQDGTEVGNDTWLLGEPWNGIGGTDTSVNIPDADTSTTTDPLDDDTDNDGLMDGQEDANHDGQFLGIELDPNDFDCDNDGLGDGLELGLVAPNGNDTDMTVFVADADPSTTTRATLRDTDGGGISDGIEDANRNGMMDAGEINPRDSSDDSVYLKHNGASVGGQTTLNFYACEPGSWMFLCYSLAGAGPTAFTNVTLDLTQPIGTFSSIRIDSNGNGQVGPLPVPASVSVGDQAWFQGVQVSIFGTSTVLTTTNMTPLTIQ
jgi:predicted outer membrane repeat protein